MLWQLVLLKNTALYANFFCCHSQVGSIFSSSCWSEIHVMFFSFNMDVLLCLDPLL